MSLDPRTLRTLDSSHASGPGQALFAHDRGRYYAKDRHYRRISFETALSLPHHHARTSVARPTGKSTGEGPNGWPDSTYGEGQGSGRPLSDRKSPVPPRGITSAKARAFWRRCVRDRDNTSQVAKQKQRDEDITTVRHWATKQGLVIADFTAYYGMPSSDDQHAEESKLGTTDNDIDDEPSMGVC